MSDFRLLSALGHPVLSSPVHAKLVRFGGHAGGHMKPGDWSDPQMALSDTGIRTAKRREKQYKLNDKKGLLSIVRPTGGRLLQPFRLRFVV